MAIGFQIYLLSAFCLSARADYLSWRRKLVDNITEFAKSNPTKLDVAVAATMDSVGPSALSRFRRKLRDLLVKLRPEAPDAQKTIELQAYANGQSSFYRMLPRIYWPVVAHHALLFLLPLFLWFISVGFGLLAVSVPFSLH